PGDLGLDEPVPRPLGHAVLYGCRGPEADVDVGGVRLKWVEGPGAVRFRAEAPRGGGLPEPQRADPHRFDGQFAQEPVEELGGAVDGHLDVLHHPLSRALPLEGADLVAEVVAVVEPDDLPVRRRPEQLLRPEAPDARVLHTERPRAPEPVGVPAPEVVADREPVALDGPGGAAVLEGAVVDR